MSRDDWPVRQVQGSLMTSNERFPGRSLCGSHSAISTQ